MTSLKEAMQAAEAAAKASPLEGKPQELERQEKTLGEVERELGGQSSLGEKIAERAASVGNFQDSTSYSQPDFVADYDRFFDIVDDQVAARLRTDGFAVVDGIFGSDWAHAFLDELHARAEHLRDNLR